MCQPTVLSPEMSEIRPEPVIVRRDGVLVEGPDALAWLQGQLSQDLGGLAVGEQCWSLILSPQGKLVALARATRLGDERILLDLEAGYGEGLAERLRRFKLRVKATIEQVAVVCEQSGGGWEDLGRPVVVDEGAGALDERAGARSVGGSGDAADVFEFDRILAGVPRLGAELTEATIPHEGGEELIARTVSFTKGCYTGQELVARLDARGSNVPRRLRIVRGRAGDLASPQAGDRLEAGESDIGTITSGASDPAHAEPWAALASVKRSALQPESIDVVVVAPDGTRRPGSLLGGEPGRG
jgi:folate-binding protein YgfZ